MKIESFTETDPAKVKPCLFCGSVGVEMHSDEMDGWLRFACLECNASVEVRLIPGLELEGREREAFEHGLEGWNRSMCFYRLPREKRRKNNDTN